ncbi:hypothetical protein Cni_G03748 [Canna indica]|uniref:Uncharacterized protein n=1 Tax=Canna indica TaxID=4628 RepID=A0AAQ3JU98_9LILI|nr:hypothetical protein Cni_G03748 [Canna indica]
MRAVTGSVVSSKPISLSKASAILSRFAADHNAARPEVAAYIHRASADFIELVRFHREIRAARKLSELEKLSAANRDEEERRGDKKSRKRRRDESEDGEKTTPRFVDREETNLMEGYGEEMENDGERKKKRKKAIEEERSIFAMKEGGKLVSNGNLVEEGRHCGYGEELLEDGKRKKIMKAEEEIRPLGRKVENSDVEESPAHKEKHKKKKK